MQEEGEVRGENGQGPQGRRRDKEKMKGGGDGRESGRGERV